MMNQSPEKSELVENLNNVNLNYQLIDGVFKLVRNGENGPLIGTLLQKNPDIIHGVKVIHQYEIPDGDLFRINAMLTAESSCGWVDIQLGQKGYKKTFLRAQIEA